MELVADNHGCKKIEICQNLQEFKNIGKQNPVFPCGPLNFDSCKSQSLAVTIEIRGLVI